MTAWRWLVRLAVLVGFAVFFWRIGRIWHWWWHVGDSTFEHKYHLRLFLAIDHIASIALFALTILVVIAISGAILGATAKEENAPAASQGDEGLAD